MPDASLYWWAKGENNMLFPTLDTNQTSYSNNIFDSYNSQMGGIVDRQKRNNSIYLAKPVNGSPGSCQVTLSAYYAEPVDLTQVTKVKTLLKNTSDETYFLATIGIYDSVPNEISRTSAIKTSTISQIESGAYFIREVDVSDVTGTKYINVYHSYHDPSLRSVEIYALWLE